MEQAKAARTFLALGTINSIHAYGSGAKAAADAAMQRVLQIHGRMSAFQEGSDVEALNAAAGTRAVPLHPDTVFLLALAQKCARVTNGVFDITLRPLSSLWGVGKNGSSIPPEGKIKEALSLSGMDALHLDVENRLASLERPGQSIDLGGIAKGYTGDEAARILTEYGIQNGLISLGGNIIALGLNPEGRAWRIGVQNPLMPRGASLASLDAKNVSVVTSGANERFFLKDGRFFHHILDPRTGMPACSGLLSVTVASPSGAVADALATALFILGAEEGLALCGRDPEGFFSKNGAQALFIKENLIVAATPGMSYAPAL